ncbi:MAG: hypothetical protein JJT75_01235, partial [Opitutales bacterium]|nr:hypothetical protein [Opitutales bacterium]
TKEEREALETMTRSGKIPAKKFMHARALLLCDAGELGDPWKVADVAALICTNSAAAAEVNPAKLRQALTEGGSIML